MKVILLKEVKGRGGEGDVIEVKDGFANNMLIKNGYALKATKGNLAQLEQRRANIAKREEVRLEEAREIQNKLDGIKIRANVQIGDEGQLFGSVTNQLVADAIKAKTGIEVDKRRIDIRKAIREVGMHQVEFTVYRDIKAFINVIVGAEDKEKFLADKEKAKKSGKKANNKSNKGKPKTDVEDHKGNNTETKDKEESTSAE